MFCQERARRAPRPVRQARLVGQLISTPRVVRLEAPRLQVSHVDPVSLTMRRSHKERCVVDVVDVYVST